MRVVRAAFPKLNAWLNGLPDPRVQEMCLYTAAHLWWHIIATFLSRKGSRNALDLCFGRRPPPLKREREDPPIEEGIQFPADGTESS